MKLIRNPFYNVHQLTISIHQKNSKEKKIFLKFFLKVKKKFFRIKSMSQEFFFMFVPFTFSLNILNVAVVVVVADEREKKWKVVRENVQKWWGYEKMSEKSGGDECDSLISLKFRCLSWESVRS
jgi:hypothetical protein